MARTAAGSRSVARESATGAGLFQRRIAPIFFSRRQFVLCHHPLTGVPAKERVVIAWGTNLFRFLKLAQGFAKLVIGVMTCAWAALGKLRLCSPFSEDSRVIGAFVITFDPTEKLIRLGIADPIALAEAVGDREQEGNQGRLIFRIRMKNIEANALRFARFVQQSIAFSLFQR